MKENQELKSESVGTSDSGLCEVDIRPMATPFKVSFQIPYEELDAQFSDFWDDHHPAILAALKGKIKPRKVKGGAPSKDTRKLAQKAMPVGQMYGDLLAQVVSRLVEGELLFVEGVSVFQFEPGKMAHVVGVVYYRPTLTMTGDLNLDCSLPQEMSTQEQLDARYKEIQFSHRQIQEKYEGDIDDQCKVRVTLSTTSGGVALPELSAVDKWLIVGDIIIPSIREKLLGKRSGDLLETTFGDSQEGNPPRSCTSVIKVHEVEKFNFPEVNDDLVKLEGFESLEKFKVQFEADFEVYQQNRRGSVALDHFIHNVITQSELPPLPSGWADIWLDRYILDHVSNFKGDRKKAMAAAGAANEAELRDRFRGRVYSELWSSLAANWLADHWGIPFKGNDQIHQDLQAKARSVVNWV